MDESAIVGFVAALLGAAVGALGTYFATVGAARQQGRVRVHAATGAIRVQVREQRADVAENLERLALGRRQLTRIIDGVRAVRNNRPYELDGRVVDSDSPAAFQALMDGPLNFGLPGLPISAWTTVLAPDAAHLRPALYNALVTYEALLNAITDLTKQGLPVSLPLYAHFSDAEIRSLRGLADLDIRVGGAFLTSARHLAALYSASADLFQNLSAHLAALERELG